MSSSNQDVSATDTTDTCTWQTNGKKCWMTQTHWHPIYGELCAKHAAELMSKGDKAVRQNMRENRRKKSDPLGDIVLSKEEAEWSGN